MCNGTLEFEVAVDDQTGEILEGRELIANPLGEWLLLHDFLFEINLAVVTLNKEGVVGLTLALG